MKSHLGRNGLLALSLVGLSWASPAAEAQATDPRDGRLARGRELLKKRDYAAARSVFLAILDNYPTDVQALLGVGDSYPRYVADEFARPWYLKVLAIDPGNKDAQMALGIAELGTDRGSVRRRSLALQPKHPLEASILAKELDTVKAPVVAGTYYASSDTFSDQDTSRLDFRKGVSDRAELVAGAEHVETRLATGVGRTTKVDSGQLGFETWLGRGHRLRAQLGSVRRSGSTDDASDATFGLNWDAGLGRRVQFRLGATRTVDTFALNSLPGFLLLNTGALGIQARVGQFVLEGEGYASDFSSPGTKNRYIGQGALRYRVLIAGLLPVELGYQGQYVRHDQNIVTHRAQLQTFLAYGRLGVGVALEPQWRSFEDRADESKFTGRIGANFRLGGGVSLDGFRAFGDYSVTGFRLNWRGGPRS